MLTFRSGSQGNAASAPPQSIEAVRRRARHRLIGAAVLVLAGVVGFSLLFDTQPRPLPVDIPIVIPAKNTPPAPETPKVRTPVPAAAGPADMPAAAQRVTATESLGSSEELVTPTAQAARPPGAAKPDTVQHDVKPQPKPAPVKPHEPERARALPEGKPAAAVTAKPAEKEDATNLRLVVQVGAFAEVERAREARLKLERAGLKTYTHVADTAEGKRIRVRLGPFATKAEADKAAARAKALGLQAAILTL